MYKRGGQLGITMLETKKGLEGKAQRRQAIEDGENRRTKLRIGNGLCEYVKLTRRGGDGLAPSSLAD